MGNEVLCLLCEGVCLSVGKPARLCGVSLGSITQRGRKDAALDRADQDELRLGQMMEPDPFPPVTPSCTCAAEGLGDAACSSPARGLGSRASLSGLMYVGVSRGPLPWLLPDPPRACLVGSRLTEQTGRRSHSRSPRLCYLMQTDYRPRPPFYVLAQRGRSALATLEKIVMRSPEGPVPDVADALRRQKRRRFPQDTLLWRNWESNDFSLN
ncbi:hypothetical protein EYF80_004815 [Liparis tanakae]|uniref:Uncharacterized protein n=1 Tax=Liparis tanakae TaxID=230148 RepID=A0A4Z2J3I1_9TELE|nr:hypothetical protein EYF80_004815 [Liparis tanakae]